MESGTAVAEPGVELDNPAQSDPDPQDMHAGDEPEGDQSPEQSSHDGELIVEGDAQLSFGIGGKRPTTSSITLQGGKVEVEGQFDKGEVVRFYVEAKVRHVGFTDELDPKTRQPVGCARVHKAVIVGIERAQ